MSEKILVPVLGESITEATVSKWLKQEGDKVDADEPIVELETDKVNLEVPSPVSGVLTSINSKDGSTVEVGALLGSVSENGNSSQKTNEIKKIQPTLTDKEKLVEENNVIELKEKDKEKVDEPKIFEETDEDVNFEQAPLVLNNEVEEEDAKLDQSLSPAVRKIVTENKIDIKSIKGSGKDGRILKGDLIDLMGINPPPAERKIKYGQEERIKTNNSKKIKTSSRKCCFINYF